MGQMSIIFNISINLAYNLWNYFLDMMHLRFAQMQPTKLIIPQITAQTDAKPLKWPAICHKTGLGAPIWPDQPAISMKNKNYHAHHPIFNMKKLPEGGTVLIFFLKYAGHLPDQHARASTCGRSGQLVGFQCRPACQMIVHDHRARQAGLPTYAYTRTGLRPYAWCIRG